MGIQHTTSQQILRQRKKTYFICWLSHVNKPQPNLHSGEIYLCPEGVPWGIHVLMWFFQTTFSEQSLFALAKVRLQVPYLCFCSLFVPIMNHNFTQRPTRLFQIFMAITNVARKKQEAKVLVLFDRLWNPGIDARKLWLWNSHKRVKRMKKSLQRASANE